MDRTMPIHEWHRLALEDKAPLMRILLHGSSMEPLIRIRKDYVTIIPSDASNRIGDIVLISDPETEKRYVVHRIWKKRGNYVLTWGDNCSRSDGWIPLDHVWGKVVLIERGDRKIRPCARKGIVWAWFWHQAMKAYDYREKIRKFIKQKKNQ